MNFQPWQFEDIMLGVQSAQLTRKLPIYLKTLICTMSLGFEVHCTGAGKTDFDKNYIKNRRDVKCLVKKFSAEKPLDEDWICWPCLDFLKKSDHNVWQKRTGLKPMYNFPKKQQRLGRLHRSMKKMNGLGKKQSERSEDVNNGVIFNLSLGEFKVRLNTENHRSPFLSKSMRLKNVRKCPFGISSIRCY